MRVYELAKELNISNNELLDLLKQLGFTVKSQSSQLKGNIVEKVMAYNGSSAKADYFNIRIKQNVVKKVPVEDRISTLTEDIKYNRFDSQLYYRRGVLFFHLGKHTEALYDLNQALKLDSKSVKAYYRRAELFIILNDKQQAMKDLEKAMELETLQEKYYADTVPQSENQSKRVIDSPKELEDYLLGLAKAYIESCNELLPFLNIIGLDNSDYDYELTHIGPDDLSSMIMGMLEDKSCSNQLIDFINMSDRKNNFDLWNLFSEFKMR